MRFLFILLLVVGLAPAGRSALAQAPGAAFRDCADGPTLVAIPAGRFTMGSPDSEPGHRTDESPRHQVTIAAFALGRTPVTAAEFARFVASAGYRAAGTCRRWTGRWYGVDNNILVDDDVQIWRRVGPRRAADEPAGCIGRDDAEAYLRWLSARTGSTYRLPSEAEWEYAARGGTATAYWWGDAPGQTCGFANVRDRSFAAVYRRGRPDTPDFPLVACRDGFAGVAPVARFRANPFGLFDMLGNAWQLTADCNVGGYAGAPADGSATRAGDCGSSIVRGGSWYAPPRYARATARHVVRNDARDDEVGFRVARTLAP